MSMFFNMRGTYWTLLTILLVVLVCIVDLRCSTARDERARERNSLQFGALAHVKDEMSAGKQAWNQQREAQLNEQLRTFRVMAKRFAEAGQHRRARATIALILELEREKRRHMGASR
ncbi:MAG: hypothetical protein ACI4RA_08760 [Kiritimatiellia bacterium]